MRHWTWNGADKQRAGLRLSLTIGPPTIQVGNTVVAAKKSHAPVMNQTIMTCHVFTPQMRSFPQTSFLDVPPKNWTETDFRTSLG